MLCLIAQITKSPKTQSVLSLLKSWRQEVGGGLRNKPFAGVLKQKNGARGNKNNDCVWLLGVTHTNYTDFCECVDPSDKRQCLVQVCWDMRLLNLSMGLLLLGEHLAAAHVACAYGYKTKTWQSFLHLLVRRD